MNDVDTVARRERSERSIAQPAPETGRRVQASAARSQYQMFLHPDGVHRRIPPDWWFPNLSIQHMYVNWHCGETTGKISPTKLFDARDLYPPRERGKRAYKSLQKLMDRAARAGGMAPLQNEPMTIAGANSCFVIGRSAIKVLERTPTGRCRNIQRLTWSTAVKYMATQKNISEW